MRPSWDEYWIQQARLVSTRATCPRKQVGCVLVRNNLIVASGYNGSISGAPHCSDSGCDMVHNHCVRTIHAETNAVISAARHGRSVEGCIAYITLLPCYGCYKTLRQAGINRIVYEEMYNHPEAEKVLQEGAVYLEEWK